MNLLQFLSLEWVSGFSLLLVSTILIVINRPSITSALFTDATLQRRTNIMKEMLWWEIFAQAMFVISLYAIVALYELWLFTAFISFTIYLICRHHRKVIRGICGLPASRFSHLIWG